MSDFLMTAEEESRLMDDARRKMLLEERYATVRSRVRDEYEKCEIIKRQKAVNKKRIEHLISKRNFFNKKKTDLAIERLTAKNNELDYLLQGIINGLPDFDDELRELERQLGSRASEFYGRGDNWWIRK